MYPNEEVVIIEVTGEKSRVVELLNQTARTNPEIWRKVFRIRKRSDYRGRACYKVDFQDDAPNGADDD